ncbi:MAG: dihydroorotase [Candidatus Limnocylindrales bacterium]|jgi:dihydroorotase
MSPQPQRARGATAPGPGVGQVVERFELEKAWLVDPVSGREGPGEIVVTDGVLESVVWLEGDEAKGVSADGVVVTPGFLDLHAHFREPGFEDAETMASGTAAAAHGGYTTVAVMPSTSPALDEPGVLERIRAAARAGGSPVEVLAYGAVSADRAGEQLSAMGELADAGVIGYSDDGLPVRAPKLMRSALLYAGMLGLPIVEHAEDLELTAGAEANEGYVASILGLAGWPTAAEVNAVARDLAVFADALHDEPRARLHLTHLSTAASLDLVRRANAAGLPVTCDVTPHHLAFTDEWIAGARRWSWEALGADGTSRDPWADAALTAWPYNTSLRVNPPLRTPADAAACLAALLDGTASAVVTDHAPHTAVDKEVEFGQAVNGISGIETALGVLLALVDAGKLPLARAIAVLTTGPAAIAAGWPAVAATAAARQRGLTEGAPADLVVFDRADTWTVTAGSLLSKGKNSPLIGRELSGRVLLTIAAGRLAYEDPAAGDE